MKTSEFLAEARDILDNDGWAQGAYNGPGGSVCAIQALKRTSMRHLTDGGIQAFEPAKKLLQKKFAEVLGWGDDCTPIPHMNDRDETEQSDVEVAFEKAIIAAEETGD